MSDVDILPLVARRVDLPCAMLGFEAPPCNVHLTFVPLDGHWTLVALCAPGKPAQVAKWLLPYGPHTINIAPGLSPKILRALFDKLPPAWQIFHSAVHVYFVELTPDGSATVFIEDSEDRVAKFVASVQVDVQVRLRDTRSGIARVKLTARQAEVMALAVALGYYETPHKTDLRLLAKKLGVSVGAVSELLRRGESLIITNYIDSLSESQWDGGAEAR